jgi:hypothetical protein
LKCLASIRWATAFSRSEVVSPADPVACRELGEQSLVETARRLRVETAELLTGITG